MANAKYGRPDTTTCATTPRVARPALGVPGWLLMAAALAHPGVLAADGADTGGGAAVAREAPDIVVSASRLDTPLERMAGSVTVITGDDIERRRQTFVEEALRIVPGVAVSQTGGTGRLTQVRIRGAEANQTLVLIDGIEANNPIQGSEFSLDHLTAVGIDRIEILRGPQGALYGSDAMGGVVNIVTRKGRGKPTATVKVEGGSFATRNAQAGVSGGGDDYHYALSAGRYRTGGISAASAARGNTEDDGYSNDNLHLRTGFRPWEALDIDLVGHFTRSDVKFDDFRGGVGAVDGANGTLQFQRFGRAQGKLTLFDGLWEQKFGLSAADQRADNFNAGGAFSSLSRGIKNKLDYQSALRFGSSWLTELGHEALVGVEHEEERGRFVSQFTNVDRRVITDGAFLQYGLNLWDRLFLTAGGRRDESDFFPDAATWRLSTAYLHPETASKLKGGYGTAFKAPTLFELFGFTPNFQGNPTLRPEESTGWDAGVEQLLMDGRLKLETVYFNNRIQNLILGTGQTALNAPGARIEGIEATAALRPMAGLDLTATYTFTSTREQGSGADLVRRPKHMASLGGRYRFLGDRADVGVDIIHTGRQDDFAFDAAFKRTQVTLASRTLVNLSGAYELAPGVKALGRVSNLFDHRYEEVLTFGAPGLAAYVGLAATY